MNKCNHAQRSLISTFLSAIIVAVLQKEVYYFVLLLLLFQTFAALRIKRPDLIKRIAVLIIISTPGIFTLSWW